MALLLRVAIRVPLLRLGLVSPGVFDRRRGLFGFVGQAAFAFRDPGDFLGVLLQRLDPAAFVDDLLTFVDQAFQVHLGPLIGATSGATFPTIGRCAPDRYTAWPMAIRGGQNVVLCASPATVVLAVVVTEAELKSSVVV
jgi:hypothetical protein